MITRRKLLTILSRLPMRGLLAGGLVDRFKTRPLVKGSVPPVESIYRSLGVRPLVNARGTVTIIGATRLLPEVQEAMDKATREYVQLDELMDGVARRLATLTGAQWGIVTSGASGAITAATAGCVSGGDPDRLWQIPDLTGMKDEVIIPAYSRTAYEAAARAVGVKMIVVDNIKELEASLGPRTAMVMVLGGSRSEKGPLSLSEIAALARPQGVPVLVDAAAEGLPVPNPHLEQGADLVAYSGGKYLRGPQCSGLLIGRKDLVQASWIAVAPHHGFGRGLKVGREEIIGALTAVEIWMKRDHVTVMREWNHRLEHISGRLTKIAGVSTEIRQPRGRSNPSPSLKVQWDMTKIPLTGQDVERLLWEGNPRIAVSGAGSFLPFPPNTEPDIRINSSQLEDGEEHIIADRVYAVLTDAKPVATPRGPAKTDVSGQWDLEMKFAVSIVLQVFSFEQDGNELVGTHYASFAPRKLTGSIHGDAILVRSSYTGQGSRLNFEFRGKVQQDTMAGKVSMGEYGMAGWKAKRRS